VSTLIYSVREDWAQQIAHSEHDRRRVCWAILLVAVTIGPGVFLVDRLVGSVAWRAFLAEALSLCLYAAVAVWYGLRFHPGRGWRVALLVYVIGLAIMGVVDYGTKRDLGVMLVDSPRADEPILWAGALMLLYLPLLGWVTWRNPGAMQRLGFSPVRPFSRLVSLILAGLGVGLLIGFHFWLTTKTAGMDLSVKPWPYMGWQLFYEIGPQSLTEELFMRGVVFNELYFGRDWNFWTAALAASGLELLSLLVKQDYSTDLIIVVGVIFYTVVNGVVSAGLFRWSRSVVPGYVNNVVFGFVSLLR
jgi:hypothetical protein